MKTKLTFDISELHDLIDILESLTDKFTDEKSVSTINKIIKIASMSRDIFDEAFIEIQKLLFESTDGSPINLNSNFRNDLGISEEFIESPAGLVTILNRVLRSLLNTHKPNSKIIRIKLDAINEAGTIEDLITLIVDNYEIS